MLVQLWKGKLVARRSGCKNFDNHSYVLAFEGGVIQATICRPG